MTREVVEVVEQAYVGRTHRPCGACGALVWIPQGCAHMRAGREPMSRDHTRATRRANDLAREQARASVAAFLRTM